MRCWAGECWELLACTARRRPTRSVAPYDLCRAVRADLAESGKIVLLDGLGVVAAAEGVVSDELTIAPALRRGDVPDVLIRTLQAKRWLGAKLFCHRASLRAPNHEATDLVAYALRRSARRGGSIWDAARLTIERLFC